MTSTYSELIIKMLPLFKFYNILVMIICITYYNQRIWYI